MTTLSIKYINPFRGCGYKDFLKYDVCNATFIFYHNFKPTTAEPNKNLPSKEGGEQNDIVGI